MPKFSSPNKKVTFEILRKLKVSSLTLNAEGQPCEVGRYNELKTLRHEVGLASATPNLKLTRLIALGISIFIIIWVVSEFQFSQIICGVSEMTVLFV